MSFQIAQLPSRRIAGLSVAVDGRSLWDCAVAPMDDEGLLSALEGLAEQLRIPVTYAALATEELAGRGGMCVIHGERRIIVERDLTIREKARLLAAGLAQFDFEDVFLLPAVREAIERARVGPT